MISQLFSLDHESAPKITDWIQAIGSVIAILAGIYGFIKLFVKDKQRAEEIKSLTTIANVQQDQLHKMQSILLESQKQSLEFSIQTGEMQQSNKLYRDYLLLLSQDITDTKTHNDQLLNFKKVERKNEILPSFKFAGESRTGNQISLQLQLVRNLAYFENFENAADSGMTLHSQLFKGKEIGTNETIAFRGVITGPFAIFTDYQYSPVEIGEIRFKNEDGDLYRQSIIRLALSFEIGQPEEIVG